MSEPVVGAVAVSIVPSAEGFPERLRAQLDRLNPTLGVRLDIDDAHLRERLRVLSAEHLTVHVGINIDAAAAQARLDALGDRTINVRARVSGEGQVRRLADALTRLSATEAAIDRRVDVAVNLHGDQDAIRNINQLSRSLARIKLIDNPLFVNIVVQIHGDREAIIRLGQIAEAGRLADRSVNGNVGGGSAGGMGLLLKTALALSPALIPLGAAFAAAGGAAVTSMAVAALAVKGVSAEIKNGTELGKEFQRALNVGNNDLKVLEQTAARGVLKPFESSMYQLHTLLPTVNAEVAKLAPLLGDAAGHIVVGLVGGLRNFGPLTNELATDVDHVAARFQAWATGPGGAVFARTLTDELHRVGPVLNDTGGALVKIVSALKPLGDAEIEVFGQAAKGVGDVADAVGKTLGSAGAQAALKDLVGYAKELEPAFSGAAHALGDLGASLGPVFHLGAAALKPFVDSTAAILQGFGKGVDLASKGVDVLTGNFDAVRNGGKNAAVAAPLPASSGIATRAATDAALSALGQSQQVAAANAKALGATTDAYVAAAGAAYKSADSISKNTVTMQLEGDAAGLAAQAIQGLNDATLSTVNAHLGAQLAVHQFIDSLKSGNTALDENTVAGIQNEQAISNIVSALQGQTLANIKSGESSTKAAGEYKVQIQSFEDSAVAAGANRDQVHDLLIKLGAFKDLKIPPTKLEVDTAAAEAALADFRAHLHNLTGEAFIVNVGIQLQAGNIRAEIADATGRAYAGGGEVLGPGTTTSDSIPARLSNHEFVLPADVYAANKSLVNAMMSHKVPAIPSYSIANSGTGGTGVHIGQIVEAQDAYKTALEVNRLQQMGMV